MFFLPPFAISSSIICTACQATYSQGHSLDISLIDISCVRYFIHSLYSLPDNLLASHLHSLSATEHGICVVYTSHTHTRVFKGLSDMDQPTMVDNAAQVLAEQGPKPLGRMTQEKTASLMTTTTTITGRGSTECSLAVLSTRLGQQDEQWARDREQIDELSQQLCDITT